MTSNLLNYDGPWANPKLGTIDKDGRKEVMLHWKERGLNNRQISNKVNCGQLTVANYIGPDHTTSPGWYTRRAARIINKYKNRRKYF